MLGFYQYYYYYSSKKYFPFYLDRRFNVVYNVGHVSGEAVIEIHDIKNVAS
jgi:hypothetical protein